MQFVCAARVLSLIEGKWRKNYVVLVFKRISSVSLVPIANLSYGNGSGGFYFFVDYVLFQ